MNLAPFESEVMEVIAIQAHQGIVNRTDPSFRRYFEDVPLNFYGSKLCEGGRKLFGDEWGGATPKTKNFKTYPTIDAALGRLSRKGLLQRMERESVYMPERGKWALTPLGASLIGVDLDAL